MIHIFDTTLRDGMQTPYVGVNKQGRIDIARAIAKIGVTTMEIGFAANPVDYEWMPYIAEQIQQEVCGLARLHDDDIKKTYDVLKNNENKRIHVFIGASDILRAYSIRKNKQEVLEKIRTHVSQARSYFDRVQFSPEDATRTDYSYLTEVVGEAVRAGACIINIPDTVGTSFYGDYERLIRRLKQDHPNVQRWSAHIHNDRDFATATSIAGVQAGITQVEGTVCGIGERAGNADWMAVNENLRLMEYETNVNPKKYMDAVSTVKKYAQRGIDNCRAVWGSINEVSSGIHSNATIRRKGAYQPLSLDDMGRDEEVVLGQTSGTAAVLIKLEEYGFVPKRSIVDITRDVNFHCARNNGIIEPSDLEKMVG